MAEPREWRKKRVLLTEKERQAFNKWFAEKYGFWKSITTAGETQQPYILEWIRADKPWLKEVTELKVGETLPRRVLPPTKEEVATQADIALMESKGPYYQKDYPTVDTLPRLDPTFEWVLTTSDPATGRILSTPEWKTQKKIAPAPAGKQWYVPGEILLDPVTGKFYDATGQAEISAADATAMRTEYDRTAFERKQPQRNWQMDLALLQSQEAEKERAWTSAQQRFAAKDVGMQRQLTEAQRRADESEFERDRERLLSGIPSNDWITRYTLQNQPNPYVKPEPSPVEELESNLDSLTGTMQKYEAEMVNAANAEIKGERYHITAKEAWDVVANLGKQRDALEKTWKTVQDESVNWSPQPVPQPYPNAPGWLPQFAPGLQAGQMITRQNVPTPSGQQLTAMSSEQLQQLGYYGQWTGQLSKRTPGSQDLYPWEQLQESARLMLPRTPSGAGGFGWTPSRQV